MRVFIALQWMDLLTTATGFALGASELSPIVRSLSHATNPMAALIISKVLVTLAMWRLSQASDWPLKICGAWYVLVIGWNLVMLARV
jgi:hypothetical protein